MAAQQNVVIRQPGSFQQQGQGGPGPLQLLMGVEKILIKQKKEMLEIFTGWDTNNQYEIYNGTGQLIYYAAEDSSTMSRLCLGQNRPFCIRVMDLQGQQILVVKSSVNFCTRDVTVEVPPGRLASSIHQEFAFVAPSIYIKDPAGALIFKIKSPLAAAFGSLSNTNFDVLSSDERTVVGQVSKQWGGLLHEMFTNADTFGVSMPADMDVMWKAVLLAATFVVDFQFYERSNQSRGSRNNN